MNYYIDRRDYSPFSPKYICRFHDKAGTSKIQGIKAVSEICKIPLQYAKRLVEKEKTLAYLCSEHMEQIVLTREEVDIVANVLGDHFELSFYTASQSVLVFGNFGLDGEKWVGPTG